MQARRLEVLQNTITREKKRALFDIVIDPTSFTQVRMDPQSGATTNMSLIALVDLQTVENIFDTSFLVRNGSAGVDVNDSGLPFVGKFAQVENFLL